MTELIKCYKCGIEYSEDRECPNCGINSQTGKIENSKRGSSNVKNKNWNQWEHE